MKQTHQYTIINSDSNLLFPVVESQSYSGAFVNKRIAFFRSIDAKIQDAKIELLGLNNSLNKNTEMTARVIIAYGASSNWVELKSYLKNDCTYDKLVGDMKRLNDCVIRQNNENIHNVRQNSQDLLELNTLIDEFTKRIDDLKNARIKPEELIQFVTVHDVTHESENLFNAIREEIDLGGHPEIGVRYAVLQAKIRREVFHESWQETASFLFNTWKASLPEEGTDEGKALKWLENIKYENRGRRLSQASSRNLSK